jgi:ketosteroid isomerase-like protein
MGKPVLRMMTPPNQELIRSFLDAMTARDRDVLTEILADDVVWHTPPSTMPQFRGPHRGRAAAIALVVDAGGSLFVDGTQRIEVLHLIAEDNHAAAQFRMTARTVSGFAYDNQYAFFFRYADGQIVEIWENVDTGYVYAVFGIDPNWVCARD